MDSNLKIHTSSETARRVEFTLPCAEENNTVDWKTMRIHVSRVKTKAEQLTDDLLGKLPPNESFTFPNDPPPSDIQMKLGKLGKLNTVFIR